MVQYTVTIYSMDDVTGDFGSGGPFGTAGGITTDADIQPITVVIEDDDDQMDLSGDEFGSNATIVSSSDPTIDAMAGQTINLTATSSTGFDNTVAETGSTDGLQSVSIGGVDNWFVAENFSIEPNTTYNDPDNAIALGAVEYAGIPAIVCFTTGMRFQTKNGLTAAEDLEVGQEVETFDNGYQPIRFIYRRKVLATGTHAPIVFEKGALGSNERFVVSQKHRIHTSMLEGRASWYHDKFSNNLIEARELLNGTSIRILTTQKDVEYFHIMFDNHELVWSEGVLSETWQPHRRNLRRDKALREELLSIFPEIAMKGKVNPKPVRGTITVLSDQS